MTNVLRDWMTKRRSFRCCLLLVSLNLSLALLLWFELDGLLLRPSRAKKTGCNGSARRQNQAPDAECKNFRQLLTNVSCQIHYY